MQILFYLFTSISLKVVLRRSDQIHPTRHIMWSYLHFGHINSLIISILIDEQYLLKLLFFFAKSLSSAFKLRKVPPTSQKTEDMYCSKIFSEISYTHDLEKRLQDPNVRPKSSCYFMTFLSMHYMLLLIFCIIRFQTSFLKQIWNLYVTMFTRAFDK